jgi:hypothetical protein
MVAPSCTTSSIPSHRSRRRAGAPASRSRPQEDRLERAAGQLRVLGDRSRKCRSPSVPVGPVEHVTDRPAVVELQALGLRERPFEAVGADGGGEVEEGAGDRGDRHAFVGGGVAWEERGLVSSHTGDRVPPVWGGHIDGRLLRLEQSPPRGRAAIAEHGPLAAREHRRHVPPFAAEPVMADRIHTAMKAMNAARAKRLLERAAVDAARAQLLRRRDSPTARWPALPPPARRVDALPHL